MMAVAVRDLRRGDVLVTDKGPVTVTANLSSFVTLRDIDTGHSVRTRLIEYSGADGRSGWGVCDPGDLVVLRSVAP
jgi:hypothetical protein